MTYFLSLIVSPRRAITNRRVFKKGVQIIRLQKNPHTVQSNIQEFLAILTRYPVINLSAPAQSLEEIFLQYYGGNNG